MSTVNKYPRGYCVIPADKFNGENFKEFGFKKTPVTNAEYADLESNRRGDRFVLLKHAWLPRRGINTGETEIIRLGKTFREAAGNIDTDLDREYGLRPLLTLRQRGVDLDKGWISMAGLYVLLKMVDNPSARYDNEINKFSGENQPAVGVTWFHAKVWNLLKTLESKKFDFNLPSDDQHYYVASNKGTQEYGTEGGSLFNSTGKRLAHIDTFPKWYDGYGYLERKCFNTVAVDDPQYIQELPFGVQTTGNVWRWMDFNPTVDRAYKPYGLRGGDCATPAKWAQARYRDSNHANSHEFNVGFSSVATCRRL